ncbi:MAG: hypothetical protein GY852_03485, partial [bacterium]|nr:hypothetical protein [bacterium]
GIASLLVVVSLFENYYLSMERVFMGIHPHIEVHKAGMNSLQAQALVEMLRKAFPDDITMLAPALYKHTPLEIMETESKKTFCVVEKQKEVCLDRKQESGATVNEDSIVTRYGFDVLKRETVTVLLKGISIEGNETVMRLKSIITGSTELDRLKQTHNENGVPIPRAFLMEGISAGAVLDDYLLRIPEGAREPLHFRLTGTLDLGRKKGELPL